MKTVYSPNGKQLKIYGDYSPHCIDILKEAVDYLGGEEAAFHYIKKMQASNLMPRMGSESRPLTVRDIQYALENESLSFRKWQWRQIAIGNHYWYGYGYQDGHYFVLVNSDGSVSERVNTR